MSLYRSVIEHAVTVVEATGAGVMVAGGAVVLARHAPAIARRRLVDAHYRARRSDPDRVCLSASK